MSGKNLNGLDKAAVLLKSLPAKVVEKVLSHMDAPQAMLIRAALVKIGERTDLKEITATVLEEVSEVMNAPRDKPAAPAALKLHAAPAPAVKSPSAVAKAETKVDIRLPAAVPEPT